MSEECWRDPRLGTAKEVRVPGGTVRYHDVGSGPAIVFVHGYLVNANTWRKLVPLLADRFRCLTPDWPLGAHTLPMPPDADVSPPGIASLIADFLEALDLDDVTLFGNDSGGAYSQVAVASRPERVGRLVLSSCETPWCSWPPGPGGYGILKAAARYPATHRALYQPLRSRHTWRWPNTYGWLAKYPIDAHVMRSYVRPVVTSAEIRRDGRRAIRRVSPEYVREAARKLPATFDRPVLLLWAAEDRVFPVEHARRYAAQLGATLQTVPDAYTYLMEDQPERTADALTSWTG